MGMSGIAAPLLPEGATAHSTFKIQLRGRTPERVLEVERGRAAVRERGRAAPVGAPVGAPEMQSRGSPHFHFVPCRPSKL